MSKVLIVDDEPDLLLMLRMLLQSVGYDTGLAADGQDALDRIRKEHFDLVLLDVLMPVLDGWQVLEALKADDDAPPVIVVSAIADQNRTKALDLGARAVIAKPFDTEELLASVRAVMAA